MSLRPGRAMRAVLSTHLPRLAYRLQQNHTGISGEELGSSGGWVSSGSKGTGVRSILASSSPGRSKVKPPSRFVCSDWAASYFHIR